MGTKSFKSVFSLGFAAALSMLSDTDCQETAANKYQPDKLSGGTPCKGRKHLSKKKRKQLKQK